ncbi:MAG TPA: dihydrolipoamide acetyltransferase family protein [Desulfuromonadales bacterium]|nr:dihydrolipoamide acetyltransferase family protein [Desulfuromonadales bacterium]
MVEFKLPDVGEGITEGEIVRWRVEVGQQVKEHQALVDVETDKALVELPSPVAGTIRELRGEPGKMVPVGAVLALIEEEKTAKTAGPAKPSTVGVVGELEEAQETSGETRAGEEPPILPRDRKRAEELGIDLRQVRGSGSQGRVTEKDLQMAAEKPTRPTVERVPLRGVRRTMAKTMAASAFSAVQATIMEQADGLALRQLRQREAAVAAERGVRLTWLPFIVKALTLALDHFPLLNSTYDPDKEEILQHRQVNIGFAVDTPDGLLVPVLRNVRSLSILDLAEALQDLTERARERKLAAAEFKGGTFTVSNYGALGGIWGTPVINPPEVAILGVGRIEETPVVRDGAVVARPLVPLSLTFDHRFIDGATAQRFLNDLVRHLEDPDIILLEN